MNSNQDKIRLGDLGFRITHRCNLACPWCSIGDRLEDDSDVSDAEYLEIARQKLMKYKADDLVILGGEPALRKQLCYDLVELLRQHNPTGYLSYMTNGLLLDESMTEWFVDNDIRINVATTGKLDGVKNIKVLLKNTAFMKVFPQIRYRRFTIVIDPGEDFSNRVIALLMMFGCPISLAFNIHKTVFTEQHFEILERNIVAIMRHCDLNSIPREHIHFVKFFKHKCIRNGVTIEPDGSETGCRELIPHDFVYAGSGCLDRICHIGQDAHDRICEILDKHSILSERRFTEGV